MCLKPSPRCRNRKNSSPFVPPLALQERMKELLEKNRSASLSADEQRVWEQYQYVEHLVRLAKARAAVKLKEG